MPDTALVDTRSEMESLLEREMDPQQTTERADGTWIPLWFGILNVG